MVQGSQPMERARVVVQARERSRVQRAEQGQLLLQAADRGVEGGRLRGSWLGLCTAGGWGMHRTGLGACKYRCKVTRWCSVG